VRHARYLTLGLAPVCAALLIADLGRPARFHHMLRVFKGSSPLNVGTYILTIFGVVSGVLAVRQVAEDGVVIRRDGALGRLARVVPGRPFTAAHGLLGLALAGYTGTLLAVTAVPLWVAGGALLGPLFLATGLASGAAALRLMGMLNGTLTAEAGEDIADVESVAALAQLGLVAAREVMVPPRVGRPLKRGPWSILWRGGAVGAGMLGPLALNVAGRVAGPRARHTLGTISAGFALAGALAERFAITEAGKRSADDPLAYQAMTRGLPGEARPTAAEQAARASDEARQHPFQAHQVVRER
jgi:formate-dependent nitrite reductase membrane component NrfD